MKETLNKFYIDNKLCIESLIHEYSNYIYSYISNSINTNLSQEDYEEVISDVFTAIWKNSNKLDRNILIKPYLLGITKNIIKNKYRSLKFYESIDDYENKISNSLDLSDIFYNDEQYKIINDSLFNLKEKEYQTFILYYYKSNTIKNIANQLNQSEDNIKVILHRVRKKLKKKLNEGGYYYGK